jgi:hypothetical protein
VYSLVKANILACFIVLRARDNMQDLYIVVTDRQIETYKEKYTNKNTKRHIDILIIYSHKKITSQAIL